MKKSILKINGVQELSKENQQKIKGGTNYICCNSACTCRKLVLPGAGCVSIDPSDPTIVCFGS